MLHMRVAVDSEEPKVPYETREQIPDVIVTHEALLDYAEKLRQRDRPASARCREGFGLYLLSEGISDPIATRGRRHCAH